MGPVKLSEKEQLVRLKDLKMAISDSDKHWVTSDMENWNDELLFVFLRSRNYDVKSTFERIQKVISVMRKTHVQFCEQMYPFQQQSILKNRAIDVLKNRDSKGCTIFQFRYNFWKPNEVSLDDLMRAIFLIALEVLHDKTTQENGIVIIWDLAEFTLSHAAAITPGLIRKYASLINNANPIKAKGIHILNAPRIFNVLLTLIKFVLSQKINKRIYLHGSSLESLHNVLSPDVLPKLYGGKLDELESLNLKIVPALLTPERNSYYHKFLVGKDF